MKPPSTQLRAVLEASTASWPKLRIAVRKLSTADLAEAERLERLGQRRVNAMRIFRAERYRRSDKTQKMTALKVETAA